MMKAAQECLLQSIDLQRSPCAPNLRLSVLRLDKIHPIVSGNKIFKLQKFIERAQVEKINQLITFGGAFSNHLVATAFAGRENNLQTIGIVRGEKPATLSPTLSACITYGMKLHFISRTEYDKKNDDNFLKNLILTFGASIMIPEGGYSIDGAQGASAIMDLPQLENATHIVVCAGTATTLAGLLFGNSSHKEIIAVPVIKNMIDLKDRIRGLCGILYPFKIWEDYHFNGYGKKNDMLLQFMNDLYENHNLPTDFVYTAKMMYGIFDKISQNYFQENAHIVALHTGGLQGNQSLEEGTLVF